jgi:hypothetical protein
MIFGTHRAFSRAPMSQLMAVSVETVANRLQSMKENPVNPSDIRSAEVTRVCPASVEGSCGKEALGQTEHSKAAVIALPRSGATN